MSDHIKSLFFKSLERVFGYEVRVCVQCHNHTVSGYVTKIKEDILLHFCSHDCAHKYWNEYGKKMGVIQSAYCSPPS